MTPKHWNLLEVFEALWRERNVTRAARALGLTQPALSRALARLRDDFGDPLFVRGSRGVVPTPRAVELAPQVAGLLEGLGALYGGAPTFDPKTLRRTFTVVTTDYFETLAAATLLPRLLREAPGVSLNFRTGAGVIPKESLERGESDLAVAGVYESLPEGFFQQRLLTDPYCCALRKDHPTKRLTVEAYTSLGHVLVTPRGDLQGTADRALAKAKRKRHVAVGVSHFLSAGWLVAQSDLVLSAPSRIVHQMKRYLPLKEFPSPVNLPALDLYQVWHQRGHQDPALRWLREAIAKALVGK